MSFKIAAYRKAELALAKQVAMFEALKTDPELKKELEFIEHLDDFLKLHSMTRSSLQAFLAMQGIPKNPSHKAKNPKPPTPGKKPPISEGRTYVNPHTNETILVKRKDHGVYQGWIAEHGADEVESWFQPA